MAIILRSSFAFLGELRLFFSTELLPLACGPILQRNLPAEVGVKLFASANNGKEFSLYAGVT